jgi:anti-sigma regulatory factor (Ser/Thr protein kinase)
VARPAAFLFALVSCTFVAFGWVADRALDGQVRRAREEAQRAAAETARLAALAVRAALAPLEQRVLSQAREPAVVSERLPVPPSASAPGPGGQPYDLRPRPELARLLHSTSGSPSGLPEAALARLALGDAATVSLAGEPAPPDVAARLLSGALPVHPDDLPFLARALGVGSDPRVALLAERLRVAPEAGRLPRAPAFHRVHHRGVVEGWTLDGQRRVRYEVPVTTLLEKAHVPREATLAIDAPSSAGASADVPEVESLSVRMPAPPGDVLRLRALRIALWIAVGASMACLLAMRRALAAEARATAREKRFLASVTHELRTPLAAMRLFGERLAQGRGDPHEYGVLVAEESQRLEALVERVLAATRASERPQFAPVEPGELLRAAVTLVGPRAERRDVTLTCRAAAPLPTVTWDAEAVRRAVLNLLDNAIKHGRHGGRVEAAAFPDGEAVCLSVSDDGPGIGRRERKDIFRRFVRGKTEAPGTGLGLHFAEQVALAHGGRVDLASEEGRGCVFTLRLPARPPAAPNAAGSEPPA